MARLQRKNGLRLNAAKKQNVGEKSSRQFFIVSNTKSIACNNLVLMNKQSYSSCFVLIIEAASPRVSKFSFMGFGNSLRRVYGANMVCALTPRKKR